MPQGDGDASQGRWTVADEKLSHLPVHVALLHTGQVLAFGGSGNDETHLDDPHPAELWNPRTEEVRSVDQQLGGDVFCAGHSFLPDGRLLVAGGTYRYARQLLEGVSFPPFAGLEQAYLFDPPTERWTRVPDMHRGRWYPTLVTLGDGTVLCAAGFTKRFPWVALRKLERFTPGEGWSVVEEADRWLPLYPRMHLLPDGGVFYAGSYNTHYTFPFRLRSFPTGTLDLDTGQWRHYGLPKEAHRQ